MGNRLRKIVLASPSVTIHELSDIFTGKAKSPVAQRESILYAMPSSWPPTCINPLAVELLIKHHLGKDSSPSHVQEFPQEAAWQRRLLRSYGFFHPAFKEERYSLILVPEDPENPLYIKMRKSLPEVISSYKDSRQA